MKYLENPLGQSHELIMSSDACFLIGHLCSIPYLHVPLDDGALCHCGTHSGHGH